MIENATAFILAGGAATRMGGASKAFLEVGGRAILERQLEILRPLFGEVLVCAPEAQPFERFGLRTVADQFPGKGAPGGVYAALATMSTAWAFCIACDMPFLRPEPIELLAWHRLDADAVIPVRSGFLEPLFGFYNARLEPAFSRALQQGNPSLVRLVERAKLVRVRQEELEAVDPGLASLENVNTPEELRRARAKSQHS